MNVNESQNFKYGVLYQNNYIGNCRESGKEFKPNIHRLFGLVTTLHNVLKRQCILYFYKYHIERIVMNEGSLYIN